MTAQPAQNLRNGRRVDFRDLIYIFLIVISAVISYAATKSSMDIEIAKLQQTSMYNKELIERNQQQNSQQYNEIREELRIINSKIDELRKEIK
jgi:TolA-binding protein